MRNISHRSHRWLACAAAGAALLYAGLSAYRRAEEGPLLRAHSGLLALLVAGNFGRAYRLTTDEYQASHTVEEFQSAFGHFKGDSRYSLSSPTVISFGPLSAEVYAYEEPGLLEFLNGPSFFYRKERGQWRFTGGGAHYLD